MDISYAFWYYLLHEYLIRLNKLEKTSRTSLLLLNSCCCFQDYFALIFSNHW